MQPSEPAEGALSRRFDHHTVLVTGAGHGIGRACAQRLAAEGARVAIADLDQVAAQRVCDGLPGPSHHVAVAMDVTERASVDRAVLTVVDQLGQLDVLVNVAGGSFAHADFAELGDDVWDELIQLNLMSVVRSCRAALPHLRASTLRPAIVSISSVNALSAFGDEAYSAAKAGIGALTTNLAASLGPEGIRVNAVAPGTIRTRVWDAQPGGADRMRPLYPLGRVGEPADIAAAVAFLASTDASWITGHLLPVDGGVLTGFGRHL